MLIDKSSTPELFNKISSKYDVINQILSLGMHRLWKRRLGNFLPKGEKFHVLDLATGTGDVAIELVTHFPQIERIVGLDPAEHMLEIAYQKSLKKNLAEKILFQIGHAEEMSFPANQFDAVTMAFGIRNVESIERAFSQIQKVLKPGGYILILEFSTPSNVFIRFFYHVYMHIIVKFLGGLLSGDFKAFNYLHQSIKFFPSGRKFCVKMKKVGFKKIRMTSLCFGAATIYCGVNKEIIGEKDEC